MLYVEKAQGSQGHREGQGQNVDINIWYLY